MIRLPALFMLIEAALGSCSLDAFDYVIVGGGPAGLLVANRLSANPNLTVAVIEAGDSAYNNRNSTIVPSSFLEYNLWVGTPLDWDYKTAPQKYTSNKTLSYYAGRALGGSTAINGMTYLRAEDVQIDAWEDLGNKGWNWETLWHYYLAQEEFQIPSEQQEKNGATFSEQSHGTVGELDVGFNPFLTGQGAFDVIRNSSEALNYPYNPEANSGHMRGTTTWPMTINASTPIREDAARAFYFPIAESRPNLHVFLNTTATRIIWDDTKYSSPQLVASDVEAVSSKNETFVVRANKEVIISAGSIRSPALLEHSGVGNEDVLGALDIKTVLSMPEVGSNLHDQPANGIVYASSTNWTGFPTFVTYLTASDLFGADLPALRAEINTNLSAYAAKIVADSAPGATTLVIQEQLLAHQANLVFRPNSTVPLVELLWAPVETSFVAQYWNLLPFSQGSIHIASSNPLLPPTINPNFFQLPIDAYVEAAAAIRIRELFATAPISQHVKAELTPGFERVPKESDWRSAAWDGWIRETYNGNSHPVSTCAMLSKDLGGIVDETGKVYGIQNVRVVDASIFPTQISGHLSATIYAIAGKIADAILSGL